MPISPCCRTALQSRFTSDLQARSPRCRTSSCAWQSVGIVTAKSARITPMFLIQTLLGCETLVSSESQTFSARSDSRLPCTKKAGRLIRSKAAKRQAGAFDRMMMSQSFMYLMAVPESGAAGLDYCPAGASNLQKAVAELGNPRLHCRLVRNISGHCRPADKNASDVRKKPQALRIHR